MSDSNVISAIPRDRAGKGAARAVRRAGRVPAVIYGDQKDPATISLEPRELRKQLNTGGFFSTVYSVNIDGGGSERVLPRDVQFHPVNGRALHVDFLRVTKATRTNVNVPCVFINEEESPGIKRGGLLNIVRHEVEVVCGVDDIPEQFEFDLTGLDIGDSLHISAITMPEGVAPTITDRDFTVATIAAALLKEEEEEVEGEEEEEIEGEEGEAAEGGEEEAAGESSED
ncbi:MAG: 50S ribosomal protein L25/general stress protein Ctc [Rhodospirillales bacterium]|nr:MAG: 50S ribosomal protein L25/general stress protein Ctc [Rhodospirillales bacterium]